LQIKLLTIFCLVSLSACRTRKFSDVRHQANNIPIGSFQSYWVEPTREQHINAVKRAMAVSQGDSEYDRTYYDNNHIAVQKIQSILNVLDAAARETYQGNENLSNIPKPKAIVVQHELPNAFVMSLPVAQNITVNLPSVSKTNANTSVSELNENSPFLIGYGLGNSMKGEIYAMPTDFIFPIEAKKGNLESLISRMQHDAKLVQSPCVPLLNKQEVSFSNECAETSTYRGKIGRFAAAQQSNFVVVHSSIIQGMTEAEIISVLAHELGHYYKAHGAQILKRTEYFYTDSLQIENKAPIAFQDPNKIRAAAFLAYFYDLNILPPIEGEKIDHSAFRYLMKGILAKDAVLDFKPTDNNLIHEYKNDNRFLSFPDFIYLKCIKNKFENSLCENFKKNYTSDTFTQAMNMREKDFTKDQVGVYLNTQNMFLEIASKLQVEVNSINFTEKLSNQKISDKTISGLFYNLPWDGGFGVVFNSMFRKNAQSVNFKSLLERSVKIVNETRMFLNNANKVLNQQKVGWYTTEQEADEISAELLAATGIQPIESAKTQIKLLQLQESLGSISPPNTINSEKCSQMLNNGFKNSDGNYEFPGIGGFRDPHHSGCYRAFHIVRELDAHKYKVSELKHSLNSQEWKKVQDSLPSNVQKGGIFVPSSAYTLALRLGIVSH
jgi:Peptidase family M48